MNKGENLDINELKVEETIINSSNYDEMKFIDDWILYMKEKESKLDDSHPFSEKIYDEDSSFSSIMNFYLTDEDKSLSSEEDTVENIIDLNILKQEESNNDQIKNLKLVKNEIPCIDLRQKENLVDSSIDVSNIFEDDKDSSFSNLDNAIEENSKIFYKSVSCDSENNSSNTDYLTNKIYKGRFDKKENLTKKSNYKITTTVINSTIFMNKFNPQKYARRSSVSSSSNEDPLQTSNSMKTYDLISEAEKRTIQQNKRSGGDIPLRKFVIETDNAVVFMNDILKLTDLRNRTIIGKLSKRSTKGYYTENWVSLRENLFSCYNSKLNKITSTAIPNERNGDIENPEDSNTFLTRKYSIDLLQSKFYLCKKKGKSGIFTCYSENIPAETDLVDITNLTILSIDETTCGYKVSLQKDNYKAEITLNCLNFGIKTNDGYRFFKLSSVGEFLKWIVAFKFRLGQISLNIG